MIVGRRGADGSKDRKFVFGLAGGGGGAAVAVAAMGLVWWEWRRRRKRRGTVIGMFVILPRYFNPWLVGIEYGLLYVIVLLEHVLTL